MENQDNSILHRAKADFFRKQENMDHVVTVPEWGCDFYIAPLSLEERQYIQGFVNRGELASIAATLIVRCRHKDGKPVFHRVDHDELCQAVDSEVISRVVREINKFPDHPEDLDEAKKLSEATPN